MQPLQLPGRLSVKFLSMKRILLFTLVLFSLAAYSQKREKRNHRNFTRVSFGLPGKIHVKQSATWSVEIQADADALDRIETDVDGDKLIIRMKPTLTGRWSWDPDDDIEAWVSLPEIEGVSVNGSGDLIGEGRFKTGSMEVKVNGSGSAKIELESSDLALGVAGSGTIRVTGKMSAVNASVSGSGAINLDGNISGTLDGNISGSGKIVARGKAGSADLIISGSGQVNGFDLTVDRCDARISGSGDIEITANTEIDASISGSGSVTYKGNPKHVNSHSSGSGKVRKAAE